MTDSAESAESAAGGGPWELPVPLLDQPRLPSFPVECLPPWLREWAIALAAEKGASVDIAANLALAVVSGAISRHVQVSPRPGWYEPVNLYVIAALVPGQAKTPIFKVALRPVRTLEAKRIAAHVEVAQAADLARKLVEKQERDLLNEVDADTDPEELAARMGEVSGKLAETLEAGPTPRLLTEDVTPEGLAGLIGDHGRIMVASDEGSAMFENLAGRYTRGSASWDLFNKAHAAADLAVDRKGSAPIIVFDPALTLAITTQPAMLRALAGKPDAGERGVLARPLYAIPAPVYAETPTPAAPEDVIAAYALALTNLYSDVPDLELDEDEHPRPLRLGFAVDAREQFEEWERKSPGRASRTEHGRGGQRPLPRLAVEARRSDRSPRRRPARGDVLDEGRGRGLSDDRRANGPGRDQARPLLPPPCSGGVRADGRTADQRLARTILRWLSHAPRGVAVRP